MSPILPQLLSRQDPRYIKWKASLRKRPSPWNKGHTKQTNDSVKKISDTHKLKRTDNFGNWRKKMIELGKIQPVPPELKRDFNLAVLIGLVLGDGHIGVFPRTERLTISLNTKYPNLILYTTQLMETIFCKKPYPEKIKYVNCVRVSL